LSSAADLKDYRPPEQAQPCEPPCGAISPVRTSATLEIHDLRVPMCDGVEVALGLIRPDLPEPLPVVLVRTLYDKTNARRNASALPQGLAQRTTLSSSPTSVSITIKGVHPSPGCAAVVALHNAVLRDQRSFQRVSTYTSYLR
jgi:hypothetical protein